MHAVRTVYIALCAAGVATPALADGWGQVFSKSGSVYSEQLNVKMNDGTTATAKIEYVITATYQIKELGSAHGIDNRKCYFYGQPGTLNRTITLTKSDGKVLTLGVKQEALAAGPGENYTNTPNDNCGKHYPGDFYAKEDAYIGSKAKWQTVISSDEDEVKSILSLLGTVS